MGSMVPGWTKVVLRDRVAPIDASRSATVTVFDAGGSILLRTQFEPLVG